MRKYLGEWKGELCVVEEDTLMRDPVLMVLYWPTGIRVSDFKQSYGEELIGRSVRYTGTGGLYSIEGASRLQVRLVHGGQTTPVHVEKHKIPPPKVRAGMEIRYDDGGWQKYLKTKGWVKIPLDRASVKPSSKK